VANIFKAKTLVGRTGIFSHEVIAPNLVYNTGYQNIDGLKDFTIKPTVGTIPVLLSGDIPYVQTNSYFYVDATRKDSYIENGNILYPYKTLSSAYNAAKNIAYFHNPTYITLLSPIAENLTINKGYINLVGNNTNKNDPIRITGSLVFAATGGTATDNNFSIAGLGITATSNNKCILFSGNNPQRLFIQDCWLIAKDNGTCLYSNNTNTTSRLQGDILKLSPEGVNTTAIDIVSGTSSISFAETSSSASVLAYVRNNSTLNISNSQIETTGEKAFQVENAARLTLLNSVLTNTANPSTGIFLKDALSTAVVVGSAISVPANANSYAINGVDYSYLFYKNLYFSIDAAGQSTESKIGNNVNKNLINSYDPVVYSIGDQTISGVKTFDVFPIVSGNKLITGLDLSSYLTSSSASSTYSTITNLASTGSTLDTKINNVSGYFTGTNATFTTNLFSTGSTLDTKINNVSGYFTGTNATFTTNLFSTGSTLDTKINNVSGYFTGTNATFTTNLFSTGSTLDTKINNLSGYVNSYDSNIVFTTGNQTIAGTKQFSGLYISGVGLTPGIYVNTKDNQIITGAKTFVTSGIFSLSGANPLVLPNNPLSIVGSGNTYLQLNIQNRATGNTSTADLVITANNGTDSSNFINLGINNSGYSDPAFTNGGSYDGYLFVNGGSLDIGTQTANTHIEFHLGGTTIDKTVARFSNSGLNIITGNLVVNNSGIFGGVNINDADAMDISGVAITLINSTVTSNYPISGSSILGQSGVFLSGIDLKNSKLINATPDLLNVSANFNITGTQNSRVILANSPTIITGSIVSGNPIGFNTSIIQTSSGQVLITGIGSNVIVSSYNNQFRTAAQYATISILHTGNDGYIMYGNTST